MGTVLIHFVAGTMASLVVFLVFTRLAGAGRSSAPFGIVFIGIACAVMAHFVSAWATPAIVVLYALASAGELARERKARRQEASRNG